MNIMNILIGCEESQTVCKTLREAGHRAYSCDLQPTRGNPHWHLQTDVMLAVKSIQWDLIVLHPDCTKMAVSGNRWYGRGTPGHQGRLEAIDWTMELWRLAIKHSPKVALENPKSVIFPILRKAGADVQYVQPWQFGHGETKSTGFALHNLPRLEPTDIVDGREQKVWKMGPSPTRKRDRSKTYQGIADAITKQWSIS